MEQLVVLLIPILGIMYPVIKGLMSLYGWGMQRKIFLIYGELWWLETELSATGNRPPSDDLHSRLEQLVKRTDRVHVSSIHSDALRFEVLYSNAPCVLINAGNICSLETNMKTTTIALILAVGLLSPQALLLADDGGSPTSKTGMGTPAQPAVSSSAKTPHKTHKHHSKTTGPTPTTTPATKPAG